MGFKKPICPSLVAALFMFGGPAQAKTLITSQWAKNKLLGRHLFSLHWISWKNFVIARIHDRGGTLYVFAIQRGTR